MVDGARPKLRGSTTTGGMAWYDMVIGRDKLHSGQQWPAVASSGQQPV